MELNINFLFLPILENGLGVGYGNVGKIENYIDLKELKAKEEKLRIVGAEYKKVINSVI
jgi:hypothetical protein